MTQAAHTHRPPPTLCRDRLQVETAIEDLTDDLRRIQNTSDFLSEEIFRGNESDWANVRMRILIEALTHRLDTFRQALYSTLEASR
jgi:hypothetical protein